MGYSRVDKYKELREGIKDEVGISHQNEVKIEKEEEPDDFLSFMKKDDIKADTQDHHFEDTLTEAKTFEQMREEGSEELDKALKSVKENVGKEERYNTRMDILNKIRDPEKQTIKLDSVAKYSTEEFSKGMFIHQEETQEEVEPEPKMTLLEKLAAMSPKEDAKKAEAIINEEVTEEKTEVQEELEDIQDDENEEETSEVYQYDLTDNLENDFEEDNHSERGNKIVTILNYVIIVLVIILIALLGMIVYQNFF